MEGLMAGKTGINVQDHFLNQARREKVKVKVLLTTGAEIEGHVKSFDNYSCIVGGGEGDINLIYFMLVISPFYFAKLFQQN